MHHFLCWKEHNIPEICWVASVRGISCQWRGISKLYPGADKDEGCTVVCKFGYFVGLPVRIKTHPCSV